MMKKLTALLLALLLLWQGAAMAEFDNEELRRTEGCVVFQHMGGWDTVVRPEWQPYVGQTDDGSLAAYVDYIQLIDLDVTLLRMVVSVMIWDPIVADTLVLKVGGKEYAVHPTCEEAEYDGLYMEDYYFCLTETSLPLLKAIAQQKKDEPIPIDFIYEGKTLLQGSVIIPGDDAARLYDRFIDLGGKKQDLRAVEEYWPCEVRGK